MALERRTPLRALPKAKGNRSEREIVDILRALGWHEARRNFGSGSQGGGDITGGPADVHLEVKHCERAEIWKWLAQAEGDARPTDMPTVIFRRNRSNWYMVAPLDEILALLRMREKGL